VGNDPEGLKIPQEGGGVYGRNVADYLGTDKEKYRWHFLIKNRRDMDDYEPVMDLTRALSLGQSAFAASIDEIIDVNQWLQAFAVGCTIGASDNWVTNSAHNAMFYFRPTDGRFTYFLHDLDYLRQESSSLESNSVLRRLIEVPMWAHAFYGYVYDFVQVSFNEAYMSTWADHYEQLLPEQSWPSWLGYIDGRSQSVMNQVIDAAGPRVAFEIATPLDAVVTSQASPIAGRGWIDVHEIRLVETGQALATEWPGMTTWETYLPADLIPGPYTLAAYNSQGDLLGTATITLMPAP
jgi:CotH protein